VLEPFDQHSEIVARLAELPQKTEVVLEPAATLQDLLGLGLVLPEGGLGYAPFEPGEFFGRAGCLKDSSAGRRRV